MKGTMNLERDEEVSHGSLEEHYRTEAAEGKFKDGWPRAQWRGREKEVSSQRQRRARTTMSL